MAGRVIVAMRVDVHVIIVMGVASQCTVEPFIDANFDAYRARIVRAHLRWKIIDLATYAP
jgi:hypothetical protein